MKPVNVVLTIGALYAVYNVGQKLGFFGSFGGFGGSLYLIDKYEGSNKSAFASKVRAISRRLGIKPNWLMAVMDLESGFKTTAINSDTNATGLIQFMPSTAQSLGTSVAALKQMTALQQLDYVELYLSPYTGKMDSFLNTYLAVFYPASISWSMSKEYPSYVKAVNQGFVKNGSMTKTTIKNVLKSRYPELFNIPSIGKIKTKTAIKYQTDWFNPHIEKGFFDSYGKFDERIRAVKNKSGVYIIKEGDKIVYVGQSSTNRLYGTLTRHFQQWNANQLINTYDPYEYNYKVKILVCNKSKVKELECEMFKKYKPRDNNNNPCPNFDDVPF